MSRFRHVLFIPDPFTGLRVPLGAIVEHGGTALFVRSTMLPCANCVGAPAAALARYLAERCAEVRDLDRHPGFSSQMELGPVQQLPDTDEIPDPVGWVRSFALPQEPLPAPSAPLIPQSRAEEMVAEERRKVAEWLRNNGAVELSERLLASVEGFERARKTEAPAPSSERQKKETR
jgi:hypothetical protein